MKKIALILVIISVIALVGLGACGGNGGGEATTQTTQTTQATTTAEETTTQEPSNGGGGGGGLTWNDMPIYGGADEIHEFSMSFSPDEVDYSEFEWRYYETGANVGDVISFYKDKMPDNGWSETMWMEAGEIAYGMFMKNGENDAAMVWVAAEGGETQIGLWRAAK